MRGGSHEAVERVLGEVSRLDTPILLMGERGTGKGREFEQQAIDDAVYAPLYLDPELFGVSARLANVRMWGIEWWESVPEWYIPADRRLLRRHLTAGNPVAAGRPSIG